MTYRTSLGTKVITNQFNAARRIEIIEGLGFKMTDEAKAREFTLSIESASRLYGNDWEEQADALHDAITMAEQVEAPADIRDIIRWSEFDGCGNDPDLYEFATGR